MEDGIAMNPDIINLITTLYQNKALTFEQAVKFIKKFKEITENEVIYFHVSPDRAYYQDAWDDRQR
jgi:antirestriction protein ArdC